MSENQNTNIKVQFQEEDNQKLINENQQTQNNFSKPNNEFHNINEELAPPPPMNNQNNIIEGNIENKIEAYNNFQNNTNNPEEYNSPHQAIKNNQDSNNQNINKNILIPYKNNEIGIPIITPNNNYYQANAVRDQYSINNIPFNNEPFINPQVNYRVGYQPRYNTVVVQQKDEYDCCICLRNCCICIGVLLGISCLVLFILFLFLLKAFGII